MSQTTLCAPRRQEFIALFWWPHLLVGDLTESRCSALSSVQFLSFCASRSSHLSPPIPFLRDPLLTGPPSSLPPLPTKCQIHPCPPPPRPAPRNLDLKSCRVGGAGLGAATHLPPPTPPPHARGLGSRRLLADSILGPWLGGCCNCCSGFPFTCSLCFFAS